MPTHPRAAVTAVEETMDVKAATERALDMIQDAMQDGTVTLAEAQRILDQIARAHTEAREAVVAAEIAEFRQRLALAHLNDEVSAVHLREARERGVRVLVFEPELSAPVPFPSESPLDAA